MSMGSGGIFGEPGMWWEKRRRAIGGGLLGGRPPMDLTEEQEYMFAPPKVQAAMLPDIQMTANQAKTNPLGNWGGGEAPKEKRKSFWQGGDKFTGRDAVAGLLAAVGDAFAAQNDQQGYGTEMLLGGRFRAMDEAKELEKERAKIQEQYEAGRGIGMTDAEIRARRAGLTPQQPEKPTGTTRLMEEAARWTPDQWALFGRLNPVEGPDGRYYPRVMDNMGPPQGAIDDLRRNPNLAKEFDEEYGTGASARYLGGGSGNATGGFRY